MASEYTLIDQGKKQVNGEEYALSVYRGQYGVSHVRYYMRGQKIYELYLSADSYESYKSNPEIIEMLDSFQTGYRSDADTEDLSDVTEDGYRIYEHKKLKWSAKVLADWVERSDDDKENDVKFSERTHADESDSASFYVQMYSAEEGLTLDKWLENEQKQTEEEYNSSMIITHPAKDIVINGVQAKQVVTGLKLGSKTLYGTDVYIVGEHYKYQISYSATEEKYNANKEQYNKMLLSFTFSEPDPEEIGKLIDPYTIERDETMKSISNKELKWSCKIPTTWTENFNNMGSDMFVYGDTLRPKNLAIFTTKSQGAKFADFIKYVEQEYENKEKLSTLQMIKKEKISKKGITAHKYTYTTIINDMKYYTDEYILSKNDNIYFVSLTSSELYYSDKTKGIFTDIWDSFEVN